MQRNGKKCFVLDTFLRYRVPTADVAELTQHGQTEFCMDTVSSVPMRELSNPQPESSWRLTEPLRFTHRLAVVSRVLRIQLSLILWQVCFNISRLICDRRNNSRDLRLQSERSCSRKQPKITRSSREPTAKLTQSFKQIATASVFRLGHALPAGVHRSLLEMFHMSP